VVVAEIRALRAHPSADKLSICRVYDGVEEHEIVSGAPNARAGIKVPFAPVGTVLPGGQRIEAAEIRGQRSAGVLCSAKELGLTDDASGLLVLDAGAPPGLALGEHLKLDDRIIDVDLTPNRGDCFSVIGIAREIAACQGHAPLEESLACVEPMTDRTHEVELIATDACPRFAGRVVSGLSSGAKSPDWLKERLRRAGLRPIHPVVDVTNYVMLEYGQPLHAYRLDRLEGAVRVRLAKPGERLRLLDESEIELDPDTLVIADDSGAIGLAGVMGGRSTAVDAATEEIFLESAFFGQAALQGRARRYGLHTDASVRFERGVDPTGQERALERATALLTEIANGRPGPIVVAEDAAQVPARSPVPLSERRVAALLGIDIARDEVAALLSRLGMEVEPSDGGWLVTPPSYRFDVAIEEDLIEEIGRLVGYDRIPAAAGSASVALGRAPETAVDLDAIADYWVARGFSEIVSYGFCGDAIQQALLGEAGCARLANPISQDLNVLRRSLWPGLLEAARLNLSRQQTRCRLFEIGTAFEPAGAEIEESTRIAALCTGPREPIHWQGPSVDADFFDLKGDLEAMLSIWRRPSAFRFTNESHHALNPARSAAIYQDGKRVGWLGELHPKLQRDCDLKRSAVVFEIELSAVAGPRLPRFEEVSKYPRLRRDLAIVVDETVKVSDLTKLVTASLGEALERHEVFDVYRGNGVDNGRKSIGIGLILQGTSRTLTDDEVDGMIEKVVRRLEHELGATIRN
jgi:phenylalanyl-tRNA synthetase beta chain